MLPAGMPAAPLFRRPGPKLIAGAVFLAAAMAAAALIQSAEVQRRAVLRADVQAMAVSLAAALGREIDNNAALAAILGTLVRQGGGRLADFPRIAAELLPHYPTAAYVHLSPDGVVRDLYPVAGNEPVLGLNLLADPQRAATATLARDTGRLTLGGPYRLRQGGLGIAARQPVLLPEAAGTRFWGFATVVMRVPDLLERVGFGDLAARHLNWRLTYEPEEATALQVVAGVGPDPLPAPVQVALPVRDRVLTVELAPSAGWGDPAGLALRIAVGCAFSLVLALLAFLLLRTRSKRAELAERLAIRTQQLREREADLARAEAVAQVGLWQYDLAADRATLSRVGAQITGLPKDTVLTLQDFLARVHPADRDRVAAAWAAALDGAPYDVEHRSLVNGEVRWFRQRAVLSRDADGRVRRATGTVEDITARRQVEEALRHSEARYRQLIETAQEGVWLIDPEGRTLFANARLGELLGVSVQDIIGRSFLEFIDETWRPVALANLARRNQGIKEVHEFCFTRPDGAPVWTLISTNPIFDDQGRVEAALAMVADITGRKVIEQALARERELLTQAERLAQVGGWEMDLNTKEMQFSPGWCAIHGIDPAGPTAPDAQFVIHPLDRDGVKAQINRGIAAAGVIDLRYRIVRWSDGAVRWMHAVGKVLRDERGHATRLIGAVQDVSDQEAAQAELRIAAIAFEAQAGLLVTDADERILRVNRAFTRLTGYAAREVVGQTPRILASGRHDPAFFAALWEAVRVHGHWEGEIWNRRKSGEVFPDWLTISAVRDGRGVVTHYVGTLTDLTAQKAVEAEFRQLAFYDPLTRLPNRRLLMDRLDQALAAAARSGQAGALLFIDLDHFKELNDSRGHQVGDLLLEEVARRLTGVVRQTDTVSRLGGDEFVVLLTDLGPDAETATTLAEAVAAKILAALDAPYELAGQVHHSTPSLGVALFGGGISDLDSAAEVLRRADQAMYQAKAVGRNTVRFFAEPASA